MTFAEQVFGKDPATLTITDLEDFFQVEREENDQLEFKSYEQQTGANDQLKHRENKILQSICGFLNSGGGFLVWGSPSMVPVAQGKTVCKGPLKPVPHEYHKDDFIAKLANNIIPAPQGIRFHPFAAGTSFVYLIEVEKSVYSPHQVGNKYYMRLDGQTVPAPHHYIEALFKKISFPNLEAYLVLDSYSFLKDSEHSQLQCLLILRNQSPYLNDFDLHFRVFSSHGLITQFTPIDGIDMRGSNAKASGDYTDSQAASTLYYGNWIDRKFSIIFSRTELQNQNFDVNLRIQFGAKLSPLKLCFYSINLEYPQPNLFYNITSKIENRPFNVHEEYIGKSDQERLHKTLNRPNSLPPNS